MIGNNRKLTEDTPVKVRFQIGLICQRTLHVLRTFADIYLCHT